MSTLYITCAHALLSPKHILILTILNNTHAVLNIKDITVPTWQSLIRSARSLLVLIGALCIREFACLIASISAEH